jgi:hypothetical protein
MYKNIGLLVGGLGLLLVSTASATTTPQEICGSVGSQNGSILFNSTGSPNPGAYGSAVDNANGSGTITCNGFTVPVGQTLVGVTVIAGDDANYSQDLNSQLTYTWTYSGEPLAPVPGGTFVQNGVKAGSLFEFGECTGTGTLVCNTAVNFSPVNSYSSTISNSETTGSFFFTVANATTGPDGDGLGPSGGISADVFIQFTYVPTSSIPEPTSLVLIGTGLIGLGVFARRKRRN